MIYVQPQFSGNLYLNVGLVGCGYCVQQQLAKQNKDKTFISIEYFCP